MSCSLQLQGQTYIGEGHVPRIVLDENTTRENAAEALALVQRFVMLWEKGKHRKACATVIESERKRVRPYIEARSAKLNRIYLLTVRKSGARRADIWRAKAHLTLVPSEEMGIELIRDKGRWWVVRGYEQVSLLDGAVRESNIDEVKRLVRDGADVNEPTRRRPWGQNTWSRRYAGGYTPLTRACSAEAPDMTAALVSLGAEVDRADGAGRLPVLCALMANDTGSLKVLIEAGCNLSPKEQHVLMHGFPHNKFNESTEFFLLENGAGAVLPPHGLFFACQKGRKATVRWMLENGCDVEANYGEKGSTQVQRLYHPIHAAVLAGHTDIVALLLQHGAKIDGTPELFSTPLMFAAHSRDTAMLELLLSKGAEPGVRNSRGWNALHAAAFQSSLPAIKALLASSPKLINSRTDEGETPLWFACIAHRKDLDAINFLLEHGADRNATNDKGESILEVLARDLDIVKQHYSKKRVEDVQGVIDLLKTLE